MLRCFFLAFYNDLRWSAFKIRRQRILSFSFLAMWRRQNGSLRVSGRRKASLPLKPGEYNLAAPERSGLKILMNWSPCGSAGGCPHEWRQREWASHTRHFCPGYANILDKNDKKERFVKKSRGFWPPWYCRKLIRPMQGNHISSLKKNQELRV